jgi:creatinine amidohydrolase
MTGGPRPFVLHEANLGQLQQHLPRTPILPWGATEAHNRHLPHGTDVIEAERIAIAAAELAFENGARPLVLPTIPFGNNAQQLDQVATIHLRTSTAQAILTDVVDSLKHQGFDRLVILNGHGGNEFKPLIRDLSQSHRIWIVLVNFFQLIPDLRKRLFPGDGDHADASETSLLQHLTPEWVQIERAGPGSRVPNQIPLLEQPGVWTPRPWSIVHPDTGSGDPSTGTASKGEEYFTALTNALAQLLQRIDAAQPGQVPFPSHSR